MTSRSRVADEIYSRFERMQSENKRLSDRVNELEYELKGFKLPDVPVGMPVPRLEIRWEKSPGSPDWSSRIARYSLVYKHYLGDIVAVSMGLTKVTGGIEVPTVGDLPFRDGVHLHHDKDALRLPAFVVVGNEFAPAPSLEIDRPQVLAPNRESRFTPSDTRFEQAKFILENTRKAIVLATKMSPVQAKRTLDIWCYNEIPLDVQCIKWGDHMFWASKDMEFPSKCPVCSAESFKRMYPFLKCST